MDPTLTTKRLHISGLTPTLTPKDLTTRLSHFGTVKSIEGFDKLDGVGQPRKFGFVEMEIGDGALRRCLTTLSGTTYKGAKLRIGEAKPDYAARLAKERADQQISPPTKKRRTNSHSKYTATYHPDMTPITRENAGERPGWKVMPSGRVVRVMKMRPGKPLVGVPVRRDGEREVGDAKGKGREGGKERKKKMREPDVRARVKTIDVTKWDGGNGAPYLRGEFLSGSGNGEVGAGVGVGRRGSPLLEEKEQEGRIDSDSYDSDSESENENENENENETQNLLETDSNHTSIPVPPQTTKTIQDADSTNLLIERAQTLSFIDSLFVSHSASTKTTKPTKPTKTTKIADADANADVDVLPVEWDSDIDLDEAEARVVPAAEVDADAEEEYEVVPKSWGLRKDVDVDVDGDVDEDEVEVEVEGQMDVDVEPIEVEVEAEQPAVKKNALKELFKPREDEGGFSLLNHLDLELDDDIDTTLGLSFAVGGDLPQHHQQVNAPRTESVSPSPHPTHPHPHPHTRIHPHPQPTVDPKKPLFFPRPGSLVPLVTTLVNDTSPFYALDTPEERKKRWEESKWELTSGWKKRWREAGKVGRRRGVGVGAGAGADGKGGEGDGV